MKLNGATVLLTGATGGIGHAIARRLKADGAQLILTGRKADVLAPLAAELGARSIVADLGDAAALDRLLEEAGRIDVLVANAALPGTGLLADMSVERIDANLDVNLRAPIMLAKALLPQLVERKSGHLAFIGSLSGVVASPGSALYNATKFGVRGFTAALRQDLHGTGVGVSNIEPGFVSDAGMFVDSGMVLPAGTRTVTPEKVAAGVARAITKNKGEVLVAPIELRIGARLGSLAPGLNAAAQRRAGAADIVGSHAGNH
ncbi:SDR family NAD(P)-dependent oxidoreductase [Nocardioides marmoriginsengisoli]|uniref:SDR family NAD(P)-dependent oxidoreductase n=1 Tax=Nocardioides marmoriginsengisoli TaxID=661483 RepID=A0A3N0CA96_9ACTN|nr:SDR family NAD(P)-dependent oxidoreductase [Nocardioides marmoriginsengisoli]RNL59956.1 SDR family NAD(P)-dependent oxidoreductase [Nocardioides marmoriginsengisoli]